MKPILILAILTATATAHLPRREWPFPWSWQPVQFRTGFSYMCR